MDYIEYNPANPAPYTDYVSEVVKERNNTIIKIGLVLIGISAFIAISIYLLNQYNNQKDKESKLI